MLRLALRPRNHLHQFGRRWYSLRTMTAPPENWKAKALGPPAGSVTIAAQDQLPRLPVPELKDTIERLKRSLKPLARNEEELVEAVKKVEKFENGIAKVLQERLLKRQKETLHWLEEWWDAWSYNGYRDSVVVNVSYFYGFEAHPSHLPQTFVHRAASLTRGILLFRQLYNQGKLKPESTREGPICMDTYRWMFDCCRVPGLSGIDWSVTYSIPEDRGVYGHVIVMRRGRFWKLDVAPEGALLSTAELEKQLQHIYDNTRQDCPGVGVLTASNRDIWAKDQAELASDPHNASILEAIHSSAFIVCLDTTTPYDIPSFSRQLWHGGVNGVDLNNRWVDKPIQLIVCDGEGAKAGVMGEHSIMDGTPVARMCDDVLDWLADPGFDHGESTASSSIAPPQPLDFKVSPATTEAISLAKFAAHELTSSQALTHFTTSYGKDTIKTFGVSPDSWAQLAVQLAYARLLQDRGEERNGGTYEAASTRKFFKGRTEAIRVLSEESDAWVNAMLEHDLALTPSTSSSTSSPYSSLDDDSSAHLRTLLHAAAKRHIQLAREAGSGQGVDRHLLGLRKLVKVEEGETIPEMYEDPLYVRASRWVLSTSAIFSKHFEAYGWGEVVPDGFGVAYMTGFNDYLFFTITSRTDMPNKQFCEEIKTALADMHHLFEPKSKL